MLLAGDIGGTTIRLALVTQEAGPRRFLVKRDFRSAEFNGPEQAVEAFLTCAGARPTSACFSVAGPVVGGIIFGLLPEILRGSAAPEVQWIIYGIGIVPAVATLGERAVARITGRQPHRRTVP